MSSGANDNGDRSHYRKRTFDDGRTLWGASALSHEMKLAGGPSAWANKETAPAMQAAVEAGIKAALETYDDLLRAEGRLSEKVPTKKLALRVVK